MNNTQLQELYAAFGFYKLGIDGDLGPGSTAARNAIETKYAQYYNDGVKPSQMSKKRRFIAAGQVLLEVAGSEPGAIDGYAGHNTIEAWRDWAYKRANNGRKEIEPRRAIVGYKPITRGNIPLQRDVEKFYGVPGKTSGTVREQLTTITLPFSFRIDYNLSQRTNKITVHKKCARAVQAALTEVYNHYGEKRWRELGLDRFAGSYNPRKMRGGSQYSMHAYGCALDFYAEPNGLKMRCPHALFCGPQYKPFLDIMEKHGLLPAIRLWGADAMHFQMARLR